MTNKPPPREFWLNERQGRFYKDSDSSLPDKEIHVIEKSAYDTLQAELDDAKKEVESLTQERDELKEALKSVPHDRLCAIVGGYGYGYCTCYKRELAKLEGKE